MSNPGSRVRARSWIGVALGAGVAYVMIGRLFPAPAGEHLQAWRFAAWGVSGIVYASHIAWEHLHLQSPVRRMALHVALGVAIGGFGLALIGMINARSSPAGITPLWFLALVLWPAFTAIPAFLGALVAGIILGRLPKRAGAVP